jgi:hypothetical protein
MPGNPFLAVVTASDVANTSTWRSSTVVNATAGEVRPPDFPAFDVWWMCEQYNVLYSARSSLSQASNSSLAPSPAHLVNASWMAANDIIYNRWYSPFRAVRSGRLSRIGVALARLAAATVDASAVIRVDVWGNWSTGGEGGCWLGGGNVSVASVWASLPTFTAGALPSSSCVEAQANISSLGIRVEAGQLYAVSITALGVTVRGANTYVASVCHRAWASNATASSPGGVWVMRSDPAAAEGEMFVAVGFGNSNSMSYINRTVPFGFDITVYGSSDIVGSLAVASRLQQCLPRPWPFASAAPVALLPVLPAGLDAVPVGENIAFLLSRYPQYLLAAHAAPLPFGPWDIGAPASTTACGSQGPLRPISRSAQSAARTRRALRHPSAHWSMVRWELCSSTRDQSSGTL